MTHPNYFKGLKFLLLIFVIACTEKKSAYEPFPKLIELDAKPIEINNMPLLNAGADTRILKDYVILYDIYANTGLIHVFDREKLTYLSSFGNIGGSENEISMAGFISKEYHNNTVWLTDGGRGYVRKFNIDSLLSTRQDNLTPVIVRYPDELGMLMHHSLSTDGQRFFTQLFEYGTHLFASFSSKDSIRYIGNSHLYDDPLVKGSFFSQYAFLFAKHPNKDLLACAYHYYDVLKIVDGDGNLKSQTIGPDKIRLSPGSEDYAAYRRIVGTEKYIYAEYIGGPSIDKDNNIINYAKAIHVFDWEGNPICVLELNTSIVSFDVDTKSKRIIVLTNDNEDNPMLYFNFDESDL